MTSKELMCLHIGQAGNQIAESVWELMCLEHGLSPDGICEDPKDGNMDVMYSETEKGEHRARSLFFDFDQAAIDRLRKHKYKKIFKPNLLINGKGNAGSCYSIGYANLGSSFIENVMNNIRKEAELCDTFLGFVMFHSISGGTGSGFSSYLLDMVKQEYPNKQLFTYSLIPSPNISNIVVEPYNAVLAMRDLGELSDVNFLLDNEKMYSILRDQLNIESPSYADVNKIIAHTFSHITSDMRFKGGSNSALYDFAVNVLPYPRLHFLSLAYCPIISRNKPIFDELSTYEITKKSFEQSSSLASFLPDKGQYLGINLVYRGDVNQKDALSAINEIKLNKRIKFFEGGPTGIKILANPMECKYFPDTEMKKSPRSLCKVANNTAIGQIVARITKKFDKLYSKRAYVHWFADVKDKFAEAREDLSSFEKDYEEIIAVYDGEPSVYFDDDDDY